MIWCSISFFLPFLLVVTQIYLFGVNSESVNSHDLHAQRGEIIRKHLEEDALSHGRKFSGGQKKSSRKRNKTTTKKPKSSSKAKHVRLTYNDPCEIGVYDVEIIEFREGAEKTKTFRTIEFLYSIKTGADNITSLTSTLDPFEVLRIETILTKNFTFKLEKTDKKKCTNVYNCPKVKHWLLTLTNAVLQRNVNLYPRIQIPGVSRSSKDTEKYAYVEKLDYVKYYNDLQNGTYKKSFDKVKYMQDTCRGPGKNQLFECRKDEWNEYRCLCLTDKRPNYVGEKWLEYDNVTYKGCVAPEEAVCAIKDTNYYPIQCVSGSKCIHTTGLDDNYVFCSRKDYNVVRKASLLFYNMDGSARSGSVYCPQFRTDFLLYIPVIAWLTL